MLQIVPFFIEGHSFFLNNHVYPKKSAAKQKGTIFQKSAPRDTVLQKKRFETVPFLKKGTILVPFFQRGTISEQKKGRKQYPFEEGYYFSTLGYHFSTHRGTFFLNNQVCETVPLRSLGHQNSTPNGTILRTVK